MKYLILFPLCILVGLFSISTNISTHTKGTANKSKLDSCFFEGKRLYGKIQLVENKNNADVTVKIVNSFPDLKVKFVENFADDCGEWQIVENGANLKVCIVENFADLKIQAVNNFPGLY